MSKTVKPYHQYLAAVIAMLVACWILLASFYSAAKDTVGKNESIKNRRFYIRKEILPDHSLYPALMAADRFRLAMADQERRVYLLAAYANRRLFYANRLFEKGNLELSLTTLTKAEKYLNQALREAKELATGSVHDQDYDELTFFILESTRDHLLSVEECGTGFNSEQRAILNDLNNQTMILSDELRH